MKASIHLSFSLIIGALIASNTTEAEACTRVVYVGDSVVATGRTLDWRTPIPTSLRVFPRGELHVSYDNPKENLSWKSKYGSIAAISYNMGISEGMNEMGLAANVLYLPGSVYELPHEHRKVMSTSVWPLYILDNFSSVQDAVNALKEDKFYLNAPKMPDGSAATLHMGISDASGDCAVIEYKDGKIEITHGKQYKILANAPFYAEQLAINSYWQNIGGMHMLPGTNRSSDRFARASFYNSLLPSNLRHKDGLAGVFGVIKNCAVPMGISMPNEPEISTTQWFSMCDQTKKTYYFQLTQSPSVVWVNLNDVDLSEGQPQLTVNLTTDGSQIGDITSQLKPTENFKPCFRLP
jgi:choloylglycine hydrolase